MRPLVTLLSWSPLALCLLLPTAPAHADRAVIIGISHYIRSDIAPTLPGIERDVENARQIVSQLGADAGAKSLHVLWNEQATQAAIEREISWALQAGPHQRAIIYFSGHGTRLLGADGLAHSSLVAYDFQPVGPGRARGAVMGNWIGPQLKQAHTALTLLLVDACQSGTITRGFHWGDDGRSLPGSVNKYVVTPGLPENAPVERLFKVEVPADSPQGSWVALTAVQDDQSAPATGIGSAFTLALWEALSDRDPSQLTGRQLRDATAANLASHGVPVNPTRDGVNPQVLGASEVPLAPPQESQTADAPVKPHGKLWSELQQVVAESQPGTVTIEGVAPEYKVGDKLTLTLTLKRGGYLTLVNVDQDDQSGVLVPVPDPRFSQGMDLAPGTYTFPTEIQKRYGMSVPFTADAPGQILLVALVTPKPLDDMKAGKLVKPAALKGLSPACPQGQCKLFAAHVEDAADASATRVTRLEAVSVSTIISSK